MAADTAPPRAKSSKRSALRRNPELDFARGAALLVVVLLAAAPDRTLLPPWLVPSAWHGMTLGDVLPATFATVAGVAIAYQARAHASRSWPWWVGRLARRLAVLVVAGVGLAWLLGTPSVPVDLTTLRWTDDLVRIGVATVIAVPLARLPRWGEIALVTGLLVAHSALLLSTGMELTPDRHGLIGLDQQLLGAGHALGPVDPNGITALAPTLVAVLIGVWVGEWLHDRSRSVATGSVLLLLAAWAAVVSWSWSQVVPSNATLWTGPVVAGGVAVTLALLSLGHLATRWGPSDRLVASGAVLGQLGLPVWVTTMLLGRWVVTSSPWRWLVLDGLGPLITRAGATIAVGLLLGLLLQHLAGRLVDRGVKVRA